MREVQVVDSMHTLTDVISSDLHYSVPIRVVTVVEGCSCVVRAL